jgi:hypothetical protein
LTIAAMLTGIMLMWTLGGASGRDLGAKASDVALAQAAPLLIVAEVLKIAIGVCQGALVRSTSHLHKWAAAALLAGYAGAALIAASGLMGLYAVQAESRQMGAIASALAFGSVAATAVWVISLLSSAKPLLRPWHRTVGFAFAATSLLSVVIHPAALLAGALGLAWWFGLSRALAIAPGRIWSPVDSPPA